MRARFALFLCLMLAFQGLVSARMASDLCAMDSPASHSMSMDEADHDSMHAGTGGHAMDQGGMAHEAGGCDNHASCSACGLSVMPSIHFGQPLYVASSTQPFQSTPSPIQFAGNVWRPPIFH